MALGTKLATHGLNTRYITKVRDGVTPSITPADTEIRHNFIVSNYHGHEAVDTDDASEYFDIHHNVFMYVSSNPGSRSSDRCFP